MVWGVLAAAAISGAASYFGSKAQNEAASSAAGQSQDFARRQAWKNRRFQRRSVTRSYQRSMRDMKKAGLNPILAYKQGGAGGTSGSVAPSVTEPVVNELGDVSSSAYAAAQAIAAIKIAKQQLKNQKLTGKNIEMDTALKFGQDNLNWRIQQKEHKLAIQAEHGVGTAKALSSLKTIEADRAKKYGTSGTGQNLFSIEQMLKRLYGEYKR